MGVKLGLKLREGQSLRVFESKVFTRISRPKRDEVTEDWRKLHEEDLHNLYSLSNIIRMIKSKEDQIGSACGAHGGDDKCVQNFG
jgi:hypothetical protein